MLQKILSAAALSLLFVTGATSVWASIAIVWPVKFVSLRWYERHVAQQRANFCCLLLACTQFFAGSTEMQLHLPPNYALKDGHINWARRAVVISNHQLYNDWIYTWWLSYTASIADAPIIMLKESLRKLPIIGWGGVAFGFLYMARKWNIDEARIKATMQWIASNTDPAWLVMFPEGTVTSANTVQRSKTYAEKSGRQMPKNMLLPRTKGLYACLKGLDNNIETLYDLTIYYQGVPEGKYGEDFYSLKRMYWDGQPPKSVRIHVREFKVRDIPIGTEQQFDDWVFELWKQKDEIFESLKAEAPETSTKIQLFTIVDLLRVFSVPTAFAAVLIGAYKLI